MSVLPSFHFCILNCDPTCGALRLLDNLGASFQLFIGGQKFFFIFQCHRTTEKFEKQHLYVVISRYSWFPFFLFFSFFCFLSFFFFFFFLGGHAPPLSPPQMTPLGQLAVSEVTAIFKRAVCLRGTFRCITEGVEGYSSVNIGFSVLVQS